MTVNAIKTNGPTGADLRQGANSVPTTAPYTQIIAVRWTTNTIGAGNFQAALGTGNGTNGTTTEVYQDGDANTFSVDTRDPGGAFTTTDLGAESTGWIHIMIQGNTTSTRVTAINEGFDQASPSYRANVTNLSIRTANQYDTAVGCNISIGTPNGDRDGNVAFRRMMSVASVAAWTTAAMLEQFKHPFPVLYPIHSCLDGDSTTNAGTDISGAGKNYTVTGSFAADASEPSDWTVTTAIRIGSMVARDSSTGTGDHTVST
jgi:hypothetical protein